MNSIMDIDKNDNILEEARRLNYLRNSKIDLRVLLYIKLILRNIKMSKRDYDEMNAFQMICSRLLEGWCWESASFLSITFKDTDKVIRGSLSKYEGDNYPHSWIEFSYGNDNYVFDGSLGIIVLKEEYYRVLNVKEKHSLSVQVVKECLYNLFENGRKNKLHITGSRDIADPFYKNHVTASIKFGSNGRVKRASIYLCDNA